MRKNLKHLTSLYLASKSDNSWTEEPADNLKPPLRHNDQEKFEEFGLECDGQLSSTAIDNIYAGRYEGKLVWIVGDECNRFTVRVGKKVFPVRLEWNQGFPVAFEVLFNAES